MREQDYYERGYDDEPRRSKKAIAEDDIELRQLFYRVLTLHGYSAICVSDGKEVSSNRKAERILWDFKCI